MSQKSATTSPDKGERRKRFPAWLYGHRVTGKTYRHAWALGVSVLVRAAESGASIRRQARGHLPTGQAFSPTFDDRLAALPTRLGIDVRAHPSAEQLERAVIARLRAQATSQPWQNSELTVSDLPGQIAAAQRWWHGAAAPIDLSTPITLMQTAYGALEASCRRLGTPERGHLMSLALLGIAARGLRNMCRCGICFRWAIPGQTYCHEHSQSSAARGPLHERDARRQQDVRLKRRTPLLNNTYGLSPRIFAPRLAIVVGRILWGLRTLDEQKSRDALQREIKASAHLRQLMGPAAERADHDMLRQLQARIDPHEFDLAAWGATLRAAHDWLEAQATATTHRGIGVKLRSSMLKACQLAELGMNRLEIAREMECTPTAIGHWLKRYADPSHPLNDLASRLATALAMPRPANLQRADRLVLWRIGALPKPSRHDSALHMDAD